MSNPQRSARRGSFAGYPSPFFDLSSTYMPPTVKEMFRWSLYLYMTHSEIAPIINKKCSYVITELIYETEKEKPKALWEEVLEKHIKIREMEYKLLLDRHVFGNAYCSIFYPFDRYLVCPKCEHSQLARNAEWYYKDFRFYSRCTKCDYRGEMKAHDRTVRNRSRIKLIRWNPQYVDIRHNPLVDRSEYIYRIPKWIRQRIQNRKVNRVLVEDTPLEFLTAIKQRKNIRFDESNFYHFKNPSVSAEDDAYGMPPMLPIFKEAWLYQTYKRAQEAIAMEHVLPLTLLIPQPAGDGTSPHMSTNLSAWSQKMIDITHRWRRDQNSIYTVPFPVTVENIRGDAGALNVHNEMNQVRQNIAGGLDVPQEFIYGGLNWSGSSISLRVLENLFLNQIEQLDNFLQDFVVPHIRNFLTLPNIEIRHRDFKMADDAQQKQIALSLRQTNTISDQTTIEQLGFDAELEQRRKREELAERNSDLITQMRTQAEAQGIALQIQTKYQMQAQQTQAAAFPTMNMPDASSAGQIKMGAAKDEPALPTLNLEPNPALLEVLVQHFIKSPGSPDQKSMEMMRLEKDSPHLAQAIKRRLSLLDKQQNDPYLKPLPEQKPPRRSASPV